MSLQTFIQYSTIWDIYQYLAGHHPSIIFQGTVKTLVVTTREGLSCSLTLGIFFHLIISNIWSTAYSQSVTMEVWMGKGAFILREGDGGLLLALDFLSSDFYQTFHWQLVLRAQRWKHGWKKRASIYIYALYDDRLSQDGTTLLVLKPHQNVQTTNIGNCTYWSVFYGVFCQLPHNRWFAWWHHMTHSLFLLLMLIRAIVYWTPLSTSKTVLWEHFQCLYFQKTWAFWIVKL